MLPFAVLAVATVLALVLAVVVLTRYSRRHAALVPAGGGSTADDTSTSTVSSEGKGVSAAAEKKTGTKRKGPLCRVLSDRYMLTVFGALFIANGSIGMLEPTIGTLVTHPPTHPPTYSPTHPLIHPPTHPPTQPNPTHSPT
jgi:hypothetical protein